MGSWYHDKRAGLIKEEGKPGYICRGFLPEHGDLLAAAPDLYDALIKAKEALRVYAIAGGAIGDPVGTLETINKALAKAEGRR